MKRCIVAMLCGAMAVAAQAQDKPKWELGVGAATLYLPDYRGADQSRAYALPIPYLVYRGKRLKADREGARAELFDVGAARFDVAVGASIPVSSHQNTARQGMPSLSGAVEVGPAMDLRLHQSDDDRVRLKFRWPLTYGITLGRHDVGGNGWQTSPHLLLDIQSVMGAQGWNLTMMGGPIYGSRQRHAYFYDVQPQYAMAERPEYRSTAGYSGAQFAAGLSKRFDRLWVGAFMRYDNLNGAVFRDSPLVKTRNYLLGGVAVAWVLGQSTELVTPD